MLSARPPIVVSVQTWFNRQPLAVKLLILLPALVLAFYWSASLGEPQRTEPGVNGNRPVLATQSHDSAATDSRTAPASNSTSQPAAQATIAPHVEPRRAEADLSWTTMVRAIFSVVVVIGLVLLSARVLKYVMANSARVTGADSAIKVVETTFVPAPSGRGRSAMHLVQVGDRLLLVGATDSSLSLLAEFDREDQHLDKVVATTEAVVAPAVTSAPSGHDGNPSNPPPAFAEVLQATHAERAATPTRVTSPDGGATPFHVDRELEQVMERLRESRRRIEG